MSLDKLAATVRQIIVQEGEHSPLGASASERWIECPASVKATRGKKDQGSVWAAEGTAWHTLAEITRRENSLPQKYKGYAIHVGTHTFKVDDEMAAGVRAYNEWCADVPGDPFYEVRVSYDRFVPGGFGTSDDIRVNSMLSVATNTDLKGGKGVQVWAKENSQLMLYELGMMEDYGYLYEGIEKHVLRIGQPRLNHWDEWEISTKGLYEWAGDVLPKAVREVEEGTRFAAGPWCQFCKIRATCRVRAMRGLEVALKDFEDLDAVENDSKLALDYIQRAELTPEEIAKILPGVENLKKWISHIETYATRQLIEGQAVGDYKLVEGRSNRKFGPDESHVVAFMHNHARIPVEDCYEKKLLSPSKMEGLVGKKAMGKLATQFLESTGEELIKKPPGKPKLARGDDPRPAMSTKVLEEFEDLDAEDE